LADDLFSRNKKTKPAVIQYMKKVLLLALSIAAPGFGFAQGTFNFNNVVSASGNLPAVAAPIYYSTSPDGSNPVLADQNYYATVVAFANPATAQKVTANGLGNMATLKNAASGAQSTNVLKTFKVSPSINGGVFGGGTVYFPGQAAGTTVAVQVIAWSKSLGTDFATAFAAWKSLPQGPQFGFSELMTITLTGGTDLNQPRLGDASGGADPTRGSTPAMTSFTMVPVPEPSVLALAGLGLVGAFMIRRRK
jgi:hypothetical protein